MQHVTIIYDYLCLFTIVFFAKNLRKDDFFTHCTMIISLFILAYIIVIIAIISRLFALFLSQAIIPIILLDMYYCDYVFPSQLFAFCVLSHYFLNYCFVSYYNSDLFPMLFYALLFSQHIIFNDYSL